MHRLEEGPRERDVAVKACIKADEDRQRAHKEAGEIAVVPAGLGGADEPQGRGEGVGPLRSQQPEDEFAGLRGVEEGIAAGLKDEGQGTD